MIRWRTDTQNTPLDIPYLVWLAYPMTGIRVHVAREQKISNGTLTIIGGVFAHDAPDVELWAELELPE